SIARALRLVGFASVITISHPNLSLCASVDAGAGQIHDCTPSLGLIGKKFPEIVGRPNLGDGGELRKIVLYRLGLEALIHRCIEPGNDLGRGTGGRDQTSPRIE